MFRLIVLFFLFGFYFIENISVYSFEKLTITSYLNESNLTHQLSNKKLNSLYTPASTFKIILTIIALEKNLISPNTKFLVNDKHVPNSPKKINLQTALFYSSNDYFIEVYKLFDKVTVEYYLKKLNYPKLLNSDWLKEQFDIARGGEIKVSILEQHQLLRNILNNQFNFKSSTIINLKKGLYWSTCNGKQYFGKTGSWGGIYWFNGFMESHNFLQVKTVLITGTHGNRIEAIKAFYNNTDCQPPQ